MTTRRWYPQLPQSAVDRRLRADLSTAAMIELKAQGLSSHEIGSGSAARAAGCDGGSHTASPGDRPGNFPDERAQFALSLADEGFVFADKPGGFCAVATAGVTNNARPDVADRAFFCSELVARVFELAGAPVLEGPPSFTTPRQIRVANTLMNMGKLVDNPAESSPPIARGGPADGAA
jgi:hypothetical protein